MAMKVRSILVDRSLFDDEEGTSAARWRHWCRLCAKEDPQANVNVFCKNEHNILDTALATEIGRYFWVNIKIEDELPKCICRECYILINSLHTFADRVNKVQAMYTVLKNISPSDPIDPNEIRVQYGLMDETREHIIKTTAEEEQFEDDLRFKLHEEMREYDQANVDDGEFQEIEEEEGKASPEEQTSSSSATQIERFQDDIKPDYDVVIHDLEEEPDVDDSDIYKELAPNENEGEFDHEESSVGGETLQSSAAAEEYDAKEDNACTSTAYQRKRGPMLKSMIPSASTSKRYRGRIDSDNEDAYINFKYECKYCFKKYKNPTSYRKHIKELHQGEPDLPDFKCITCEKVLPTEKQLAMHVRSHMKLEEKLDFPCPFCDKKFSTMGVMKQHVSGIHNNLKPFVCDACGRPLKTLAALNEHKLVHTNDTPFECNVCHKSFKNKARLKIHADIHTPNSYVCQECGMQLNTRRTLKMHMLVHSDLKRHKCDFCGVEFKRSKALKNHLILHTGLRPYKCPYCNKSFSNGSNCRSHKKKTHPRELEEEEAQGKKSEPVKVPKLEELRTTSNVVKNPRKVQRHSGGLPAHLRALLIAAEERNKAKAEKSAGKQMPVRIGTDNLIIESGEDQDDGQMIEIDDYQEEEEEIVYELVEEED